LLLGGRLDEDNPSTLSAGVAALNRSAAPAVHVNQNWYRRNGDDRDEAVGCRSC
jgi:hypothetical protein